MKFATRSVILLLPIVLMGCSHISKPSFIQNREISYLQAKSIPPLRVPPGLNSSKFDNYYPVSDRNYPESAKNISIVPPGLHS